MDEIVSFHDLPGNGWLRAEFCMGDGCLAIADGFCYDAQAARAE